MRKLIAWSNTSMMFLAVDSLAARQAESEAHISTLEDNVTQLMVKIAVVEKLNTELTQKLTDLEGRSRRDNIRILNLKESIEGNDPLKFFEEFFPKVLELPVMSITIDRAHRGYGAPTDGRPRPVIVKIHHTRDVAVILSAARCKGNLQYNGQTGFTPDIPPVVWSVQRAFNPVCAELIKKDIRFQMIFPDDNVILQGEQHSEII